MTRYPTLLGVSCDGSSSDEEECYNFFEADILVDETDDKSVRLGYILDVALEQGWFVLGRERPLQALTYCPDCKVQGEAFAEKLAGQQTG